MTDMDKSERGGAVRSPLAAPVMLGAAFVFGATVGALIGGFFLHHFVTGFFGNIPHARLYTTLGVALIGGISSLSKAAKQLRRQSQTRDVAEQLGFDYAEHSNDEVRQHVRDMFARTERVSLENVVRKEVAGAVFLVADLLRTTRSGSGSNSSSRTTRRTMAYFEAEHLQWPEFTMQPEGVMLNIFSSVTGVEDIDFEDAPEFSNNYHLTGRLPSETRAFFNHGLLEYFAQHQGLEVRAESGRLVMLHPSVCKPDQLEDFIEQAMQVFSLFMDASTDYEETADTRPPVDVRAAAEQMPGLVGALVQRLLVTPEELDAFLAQPTPRQIPPNIRRQRVGSGSLVAAIIGTVFALVGTGLAVYSAFFAEGPWNDDRIVPLVLGIVFPLVGYPMLIFSLRYRWINMNLLRNGVVAEGQITNVERTSVEVNNQQQYRVTVSFTGLTSQEARCNVYGPRGRAARSFAESGEPVRVLYDRNRPSRVLWAEAFLADPI